MYLDNSINEQGEKEFSLHGMTDTDVAILKLAADRLHSIAAKKLLHTDVRLQSSREHLTGLCNDTEKIKNILTLQ